MIWALLLLAVLALITLFHLRGPGLAHYDLPPGESFDTGHEPSDEHDAAVALSPATDTTLGSPASLQSWAHVVHVWHMFYPQLTEARDAWEEIGKFISATDADNKHAGESQ